LNKVFILKALSSNGIAEEYYGASSSKQELEDIVEIHKYNINNGILDIDDDYNFEIVEIEHNLTDDWFILAKKAVKSDIQVIVDIISKEKNSEIENDFQLKLTPLFAYNKKNPNLKFNCETHVKDCHWFG
jgi:hypothetical protein